MLSSRGSLAFTASPRRSTRTLLDASVEVLLKPAPEPEPEPEPEAEPEHALEPASEPEHETDWTEPMESLMPSAE